MDSKAAQQEMNSIMVDLQMQLKTANIKVENLSTIAKEGDEKLVEKFLSEAIFVHPDGQNQLADSQGNVLESQLYVACFWGFRDIVKGILKLAKDQAVAIDVNRQNQDTQWTPLHAATFQEHGPIIMMLLDHGAQPELADSEGRTPADFASASDKVWGHFAAMGLRRTPRTTLLDLGIIKKTDHLNAPPLTSPLDGNVSPREPGKGIKMAAYEHHESSFEYNSSPFIQASVSGDVLANDADVVNPGQTQPQFSAYK